MSYKKQRSEKRKIKKEGEKRSRKIIKKNADVFEFYLNSSPKDIQKLLWLIADKIRIPIRTERGMEDLELAKEVEPISLNGIFYQLNTEEFEKEILKEDNNKTDEEK
jgi:hypothetical protein